MSRRRQRPAKTTIDYAAAGTPDPAPPAWPAGDGVPTSRRATAIALGVGVLLWVGLGLAQDSSMPVLAWWLGPWRWAFVALAAGIGAVPVVRRRLGLLVDRLATLGSTHRGRVKVAVAVALVAAGYFALTALAQGRDLFPKTHDDQSYLLQMRMLAGFRLWEPAHPHPDFFDTFYVLVRPVYASLYFPGAALLYVPTIWLGLPTWVMPVGVAGAIVGLLYYVVAEVVDPLSGLLAAALLASLSWFRVFSVLLTSHEPMLLMGLVLIACYLRWRACENPRRRAAWAAAMGAAAGWAAITRPADAVCFAVPVGTAMLLDLWRGTSGAKPSSRGRRVAVTLGLLVAGASPFLLLQGVFNVGVTGSVLDTPYGYYLRTQQPNTGFGFHPYDPAAAPASVVPQKLEFYKTFYAPYVQRHTIDQVPRWWGRVYLPLAADVTLPGRALLAFLPVGAMAIWGDRRRWAVALPLPLLLAAYVWNTFFLEHYALVAAPAVLLLAVLGVRRVAAAWPAARASVVCGVVALAAAVLPEANWVWTGLQPSTYAVTDETFPSPFMRAVRLDTPNMQPQPALILFTWKPGVEVQEEPVYNTATARIDDAAVIYAHDLGPERNAELLRYYAERQPGRAVFRWDRATGKVTELTGPAARGADVVPK